MKKFLIISIFIVIINSINIAGDLEDYKFVNMISNLDEQTIVKNLQKMPEFCDIININGITIYKNIENINLEKIAISINRYTMTATIWVYNKELEEYNIPYKTVRCSPNKIRTPVGIYHPIEFIKEFHKMFGNNNYCQYLIRFNKHFLLHSPIYKTNNKKSLKISTYNNLGISQSSGCVRFSSGDAYFLYNYLDKDSPIFIYDSEYIGPLEIAEYPKIENIKDTWDPTDPEIERSINE